MVLEIKAPSPGESISEVELANWFVEDGDQVEKNQEIAEIESDKATLSLVAEQAGQIKLLAKTGDIMPVGTVVCTIDTDSQRTPEKETPKVVSKDKLTETSHESFGIKSGEVKSTEKKNEVASTANIKISPVARKMMDTHDLSIEDILNGLKRITSKEIETVLALKDKVPDPVSYDMPVPTREEERKRMSSLRRKLSERLVAVKNQTAMLTTFNEADMSEVIRLRKKYQNVFVEKYGIKLGFMSFFTKAVTVALRLFPNVNSRLEEDEIITPKYCDIGIAVQTDKGLMVPVLRNTETMTLHEIEKKIHELAEKARTNKISIPEMTGGTFTITNGGVFGSLLSTPVINPPQSGILGMHNIVERPVAVRGKVEIRPMMYIALTYDHRIIDGKESVRFLVKVKELIEDPLSLLYKGLDPEKALLEL